MTLQITNKTISHLIESNDVFICDFDDSFTFNLFSDFTTLGYESVVVNYSETKFFEKLSKRSKPYVLVLGPGPGHPNEYNLQFLDSFFKSNYAYLFGVCLGHQIILSKHGCAIESSRHIMHAQSTSIKDPEGVIFEKDKSYQVQRYNSLTVLASDNIKEDSYLLYDNNQELMLVYNDKFLTVQFHPESIGTNCPNSLYNTATKFLL